MTTTVYAFHPQLSNGSRVNAAFAVAAREAGFEVRDMYALYPDMRVDVEAEKAVLAQTDRIVLQFPVFWYQTPALMKQWLDDVLEYGWAYGAGGTALQGKEILLVPTFGASADSYTVDGRYHMTTDEVLKPLHAVQYLTGLQPLPPFVTTGTLGLSDAELEAQAAAYVETLKA